MLLFTETVLFPVHWSGLQAKISPRRPNNSPAALHPGNRKSPMTGTHGFHTFMTRTIWETGRWTAARRERLFEL